MTYRTINSIKRAVIIHKDYSSTECYIDSGLQNAILVHLFYINVVSIVIVHVDVRTVACVVGYDRQPIVRTIEGNPNRFSVANPIGEDHNRQGIEQVALDRAVERTGPVDR